MMLDVVGPGKPCQAVDDMIFFKIDDMSFRFSNFQTILTQNTLWILLNQSIAKKMQKKPSKPETKNIFEFIYVFPGTFKVKKTHGSNFC